MTRLKIGDQHYTGVLAQLIAIPMVAAIYLLVAGVFIIIAAVVISPLILVAWVISLLIR
jgi:uncharacterized membrane protein